LAAKRKIPFPWRTALFVLVVIIGVRALFSKPTLTYVLDEASTRLHDELGLSLAVGDIRAEPGSALVELGPIVLKGSDGEILFVARKLKAELEPLKLFDRRARLTTLEVVEPRGSLRIVDGAIAGVTIPEGASGGGEPYFKVDVANLKLTGGSFEIDVVQNGKPVVHALLEGIEVRMKDRTDDATSGDAPAALGAEHRMKLTVERGAITRPIGDPKAGKSDTITLDAFGGRLSVEGDGLLAPERVSVSEMTLAASGAELSIAGSLDLRDGALASGKVPGFVADVSGHARLGPVLAHAQLGFPISGDAAVSIHATGKPGGQAIEADAQVEALAVVVDDMRLGDIRAKLFVTPEAVEVKAGTWDIADTTVKGTAKVFFDDTLSTSVQAEAPDFSIYAILDALGFGGAWADAVIDGKATVAGTLKPLLMQGVGAGAFTTVRVASQDVRTIKRDEDLVLLTAAPITSDEVTVRIDEEGLTFKGTIDDGKTRGTGMFQLFYDVNRGLLIDAEGPASFESIGNRIAALGFTGNGRGHLHVEGPQSGPVLTAEVEVDDIALEGFSFGNAGGKIHLANNVVTFSEIVAEKDGDTRYGGTFSLDFNDHAETDGPHKGEVLEAPHLALDLRFEPARAETIRRVIPERYTEGVLAFLREDLDVKGPLRGWFKGRGAVGDGTVDHMTGEGQVEMMPGATLLDQHINGAGTFHMSDDRFYVDNLDFTIPCSAASLATKAPCGSGPGKLAMSVGRAEGDMTGVVSISDAKLGDIDALIGAPRVFTGAFDVEGQITRSSKDPGFVGRARVRDAMYGTIPIGSADTAIDHKGRVITIEGALLSGRGQGTVHVETRAPFVYDASVVVSQGPLAPLLPKDLLPASLVVTTAGVVEAEGALKTMRTSHGTIALSSLGVAARGMDLRSKKELALHFVGARLDFDLVELFTKDGDTLTARGALSDEMVDVQMAADGHLTWLPLAWSRAKEADGRFRFDLAITGDLDDAAMSGQGTITDGKLVLGAPFPNVTDIDAALFFRGQNVVVERMTGKLDGASASMQGAVTLEGTSPAFWDLEGKVTKVRMKVPSYIETVSSGRLAFKGDAQLPTLSGELRVHSARYTEDINWERALPDLKRKTSALESLDVDDEDVRFDIHLIADRGVVVDNNVLDLEAKGDLFLTGTDERPGLKGGLQLIRGNATFRGNAYRLPRGSIDFVDTYRVMPILDVEAETRVQDYDITAHLVGPAQQPTVELSSTPELAEIDIVSLLTFGFTQYDVRDAGGSAGAAGLEVVSAYTGLDQELRRVLPDAVKKSNVLALDELKLTSQFSMRAGASLPAVALGMEVNPGLWGIDGSRLRLQSTLVDATGNGTERRVEWEKRFDNNVRLRLNWSSEDDGSCPSCVNQWGDLGGDVWYRWEF
jgi:autotransporter translocation and assembly factor TamB